MYGAKGYTFLKSLEEKIALSEGRWKIKVLMPYNLSYNYVAAVELDDKTEGVLKLCMPGRECDNEISALQADRGTTMCGLIDYVREEGILLLEKLEPGSDLKSVNDEALAVEIACDLISQRKEVSIVPPTISHQDERVDDLKRLLNYRDQFDVPFGDSIIKKVSQTLPMLIDTQGKCYFLHGDFHHENILSHGQRWKLIDPKGLIGEIECEIIPFLMNNLSPIFTGLLITGFQCLPIS